MMSIWLALWPNHLPLWRTVSIFSSIADLANTVTLSPSTVSPLDRMLPPIMMDAFFALTSQSVDLE